MWTEKQRMGYDRRKGEISPKIPVLFCRGGACFQSNFISFNILNRIKTTVNPFFSLHVRRHHPRSPSSPPPPTWSTLHNTFASARLRSVGWPSQSSSGWARTVQRLKKNREDGFAGGGEGGGGGVAPCSGTVGEGALWEGGGGTGRRLLYTE